MTTFSYRVIEIILSATFKRASCLKALRVLNAEGRIVLPSSQCDLRISGPHMLNTAVMDLPSDVRDIADLETAWVEP